MAQNPQTVIDVVEQQQVTAGGQVSLLFNLVIVATDTNGHTTLIFMYSIQFNLRI